MEKLYHIGLEESLDCKYAILPGDPKRAGEIAAYLDKPRKIGENREYTTYLGSLDGENVLVMSTGMGGPSTAIGVEELYVAGVRNFIRVGTCGGMHKDVKPGDLVIATGAIREEGTGDEYIYKEFPAVSDHSLTTSLIKAAKVAGYDHHVGVVHCKDSFYGQHNPDRMPVGDLLKMKWKAWLKANTLASEMESASLFLVSQILGARAACVLNVLWNQERNKAGIKEEKFLDTSRAIETAIEAIRIDIKNNK